MDNKKILELARKNKNRGKEYENEVIKRSYLLTSFVSISVVGIGLFLLKYFLNNSLDFGLIAVVCTSLGVQALCEGIKLKKIYLIVIGIIQIIVAVFSIVAFVWQVVSI